MSNERERRSGRFVGLFRMLVVAVLVACVGVEVGLYAFAQLKEAEVDGAIADMRRRYPPGTDALEIVVYFQDRDVQHFRSDFGGGDNYQCPCVFGKYAQAYRGLIYHGDIVVIVTLDQQNRVRGIVKQRWLESL